MAEYQDILKFLADNPPHLDPEKKFHASLLEMLAKRLRDETKEPKIEALKRVQNALTIKKKFH